MFQQEKELTLSFDRLELIDKIRAAKKKHAAEMSANKLLEKALAMAKTAKNSPRAKKNDENWAMRAAHEISSISNLQNHEKEYDQIIDMLGAAKNATVQLGASTYRQFVQGQWQQFGFGQLGQYSPCSPYSLGLNSPIGSPDELQQFGGAEELLASIPAPKVEVG